MPKPTGPTNPILKQMSADLRAAGHKYDVPFALAIAKEMSRPRRRKVAVNLSRIERHTKEKETVMVPGKVLGSGKITKPVTIAAVAFSGQSMEKIKKAGGEIITIAELIEKHPKGSGVKILC